MKKVLKITSVKISRLELKSKLLTYLENKLTFSETQLNELELLDYFNNNELKINENLEYYQFENLLNHIMIEQCLKK